MQENLQEMINNLNNDFIPTSAPIVEEIPEAEDSVEVKTEAPVVEESSSDNNVPEISLVNFYDWYEANSESIHNVSRVKAEVSNINSKDSIIFKIQKGKAENESMELVSFYNPAVRPILNLPPVYMKIFKNDTFEVLHSYSDEIFIKSYGVKTGLILVFCANVDGKIVPYYKTKIKKNETSIKAFPTPPSIDEIKAKLQEEVDVETIQLLYKQAVKNSADFTTKESTLDWFLKKEQDVIDINHLLKIDNVLISVI